MKRHPAFLTALVLIGLTSQIVVAGSLSKSAMKLNSTSILFKGTLQNKQATGAQCTSDNSKPIKFGVRLIITGSKILALTDGVILNGSYKNGNAVAKGTQDFDDGQSIERTVTIKDVTSSSPKATFRINSTSLNGDCDSVYKGTVVRKN